MSFTLPLNALAPYGWMLFFALSGAFWYWVFKRNTRALIGNRKSYQDSFCDAPYIWPAVLAAIGTAFNLVYLTILVIKKSWECFG